jgi:hypothetical protein
MYQSARAITQSTSSDFREFSYLWEYTKISRKTTTMILLIPQQPLTRGVASYKWIQHKLPTSINCNTLQYSL